VLDPKNIRARLAETWAALIEGATGSEPADADAVAATAAADAPVIWLIGKVQSGKSSIVQAITGSSEAEVGSGFRPCTRTARIFDFPAEAPIVRFLDTRGLGEVGYDATEDMASLENGAHLLLVVMRAMDHQQASIVEAVADIRRRHPDWPVVVAQTCLHDAYQGGAGHVQPYPFDTPAAPPPGIPDALLRSLAHQQRAFEGLRGNGPVIFVPIDFTRPDDGFEPRLYGFDALASAIVAAAPKGVGAMLDDLRAAGRDQSTRAAHPLILGHAAAAAAADVVPLAGAIAVPGVQARMLYALAARRGVPWDRRTLTEFGGCLGASILTGLAARFGVRQLVKLVPVYGQTVGSAAAAAASFATTYALGRAVLVFLDRRESGTSDPEAVAAAFRSALSTAFDMARARGLDNHDTTGGRPDGAR
jgi:uncharacterized protein (DUF697 family)/predicted GTPase